MNIIKNIFDDYILPVVVGLCSVAMVILLWAATKILILGYFPVPTTSMKPSIIPGDVVFVNKLKMGPRTFRNLDFLDGKTAVSNIRFWGYGDVERNDVIVFNYPYWDSWRKASFNHKKFYVKRCIAIPGDTLSIVNGFYKVNGVADTLGNYHDQYRLSMTPIESIQESSSRIKSINGWTIKDFGPLYIPKKGDTIEINISNFEFYRKIIEWETGGRVKLEEDKTFSFYAQPIKQYKVKEDYYFVAGDKIFDSRDSRYWGLLQREYIVGVSPFVLYSKDPSDKSLRWDRFFKSLKRPL